MFLPKVSPILLFPVFVSTSAFCQGTGSDSNSYKIVSANASLQNRTASFQRKWGKNRRAEWAAEVKVPVLYLDKKYGGLKPYATGGGNESKTLRLLSSDGHEYTLRSINKSREDVVPPNLRNTIMEEIINDQLSSSYPYGSFAVAEMQEAAGIPHTLPLLVYVPKQAALDTFNERFGEDLYLFEQRLDGDWSGAPNLGFKDFKSTANVIDKLLEKNKNVADQQAFIKARLFDMLIADWDRHEDNWRWGKKDIGDVNLYVPVPRDRDQAFYTHNGSLIDRVLPMAGLSFMHNFDSVPGTMQSLNHEERYMDRFFSNQMNRQDWENAARNLQAALTDAVIERSIRQLPPEIYAISGEELVAKLKGRRSHLVEMATSYYLFIAEEVEIIGSGDREYFEVNNSNSGETEVSVYRVNKRSEREATPYYKRNFVSRETSEIRLFGISNEDIFQVQGTSPGITVRIIGGPDRDSVIQTGGRIHIYDNRQNVFKYSSARLHLKRDTSIHDYRYKSFEYDSKGISPEISYNNEDRLYVGLGYSFTKHKWRRWPYATKQSFGVRYSIMQKGISAYYDANYPRLICKRWDLFLHADYDAVRWTHFYGLGNETVAITDDIRFYRMESTEWLAAIGLRRENRQSTYEIAPYFQSVQIRSDTGKYVYQNPPLGSGLFENNNYGGLRFIFTYTSVNNTVIPTRGLAIYGRAALVNNFTIDEFFQHLTLKMRVYLPLGKKFSLSVRAGGAVVGGDFDVIDNAQLYQHAVIGGTESLRGYKRERFWGKSSLFNNNELRFITNIRGRLFSGKFGLFGFIDNGRVWMPNDSSNEWHTTYGPGMLFAPFSQICVAVTYGITDEDKMFQISLNKIF
jgi:hypothetical protein